MINSCIDNLYNDNENLLISPGMIFVICITIVNKDSLFTFNNKHYKLENGVAMGSPLAPALASIVMCSFKNR